MELWDPVPITYNSFENAPNRPTFVYDNDLLQLFWLLSEKGVSASDFCAVQTDIHAYGKMAAGVPASGIQ